MKHMPSNTLLHRGHIISVRRRDDGQATLCEFKDGALATDASGRIVYCGDWTQRPQSVQTLTAQTLGPDQLLIPGFVDTHLHFPQLNMIGCHGEDLLGWLKRYTFPEEMKFSDLSHAQKMAVRFVDQMLKSGTTYACIFGSSHFEATDTLFAECERRGMRAVIGQTSMDRHAPESLLTKDIDQYERNFQSLYERWHGKDGRLGLAITPRFAPSCTDPLMSLNSRLAQTYKDAWIQTHFAESKAELAWIKELYPKSKDYLEVYENFGLITPRTVLAHGIYVSDDEYHRLAKAGACISHCPSSNMFLGSGTMNWPQMRREHIPVSLGTDVGAGTSFSHWRTMADAYKGQRLAGSSVTAAELFACSTIDGARCLNHKQNPVGLIEGAAADFQILDLKQASGLEDLSERPDMSADELIFSLIWHWEPAVTHAVYIQGRPAYLSQNA